METAVTSRMKYDRIIGMLCVPAYRVFVCPFVQWHCRQHKLHIVKCGKGIYVICSAWQIGQWRKRVPERSETAPWTTKTTTTNEKSMAINWNEVVFLCCYLSHTKHIFFLCSVLPLCPYFHSFLLPIQMDDCVSCCSVSSKHHPVHICRPFGHLSAIVVIYSQPSWQLQSTTSECFCVCIETSTKQIYSISVVSFVVAVAAIVVEKR